MNGEHLGTGEHNNDVPMAPNTGVPLNAHAPGPAVAQVEKPEKFAGCFFKRLQQKMLFYIAAVGLDIMLNEDPLAVDLIDDQNQNMLNNLFVEVWNFNNYVYLSHILSCSIILFIDCTVLIKLQSHCGRL